MPKPFIKNLTLEEAETLFNIFGEKPYRAKQLFSWLYEKNIEAFSEMTNFSKDLRKYLEDAYSVSALELEERQISKIDDTEKYLFKTADGNYIESVLIKNDTNEKERLTICVSSQVGCAMGCRFCNTAKLGFKRNLEPAEILDQINQVRRISGLKNNNIVFMGMGEPFLNYDNVLKAADIMNYSFGFHISVRKITISTCGITDAIERFIDEKRPYNLAVSINDTDPEKRKINMPIQKKYPVAGVIELFERKFPVSRNRLTVAYVMRKDNISGDDAKRLKKLFKHARIKLNLIALNPGVHKLDAPSQDEMAAFIKELEIINVPVSVRKSFGTDIDGACGQLAGKH
ncbi:MAG: 23S rRNA (adenine(2503)-C(2))-methyltransferase RlmN [Spirochaetota bacterium]